MTLRRGAFLAPALATTVLLVSGCGSTTPGAAGGGAAPVPVVASTNVYGSIAKLVGGDSVAVTSIIDSPDADPHEYETRPADAAAVNKAKIVVLNGGGYDDFAGKLLAATGGTPATVDVVRLSGLQAAVPAGGEFNEHVWYSFPTVRMLADTLAAELGRVDPAHAATFTANAGTFRTRVDELTAKLTAVKAKHAGQKVALTEPVPLYLIEAAGLVNATPEEFSAAIEEGTDPPAAVLADTLAVFTGPDAVHVLLSNTQTGTPVTKQVEQAATAGGVPIVAVTETLPAGATDYLDWMAGQVDALAAALDRA